MRNVDYYSLINDLIVNIKMDVRNPNNLRALALAVEETQARLNASVEEMKANPPKMNPPPPAPSQSSDSGEGDPLTPPTSV